MYTSTLATSFVALLATSSALSFPRPEHPRPAHGGGPRVSTSLSASSATPSATPSGAAGARPAHHGGQRGGAHPGPQHHKRAARNGTHIIPRPGAHHVPHVVPHGPLPDNSQNHIRAAGTGATSAPSSSSTPGGTAGGKTFKASFTEYGAGDKNGSPNCNTASAACGFYSQPGFNAALSEAAFGAGDGKGPGPACGTCWQLSPETDPSGKPLAGAKEIVVKVNNLCPADSNPLCSQKTTNDKNQYGANVNFDLCMDDGAGNAFFGSSGQKLAIGTATQVPCSMWKGSADLRQH